MARYGTIPSCYTKSYAQLGIVDKPQEAAANGIMQGTVPKVAVAYEGVFYASNAENLFIQK